MKDFENASTFFRAQTSGGSELGRFEHLSWNNQSTNIAYCGDMLADDECGEIHSKPVITVLNVAGNGSVISSIESKGRGNFGLAAIDTNLAYFCSILRDSEECTNEGKVFVADLTTGVTKKELDFLQPGLDIVDEKSNYSIQDLSCYGQSIIVLWTIFLPEDYILSKLTRILDVMDDNEIPITITWDCFASYTTIPHDGKLVLVHSGLELAIYDLKSFTKHLSIPRKNKRFHFTSPEDGIALSKKYDLLAATHDVKGTTVLTVYDLKIKKSTGFPSSFRTRFQLHFPKADFVTQSRVSLAFTPNQRFLAISGGTTIHNDSIAIIDIIQQRNIRVIDLEIGHTILLNFVFKENSSLELETTGNWPIKTSSHLSAETGISGKKKQYASTSRKMRICKFYNTRTGCRNGDACPFEHVNKKIRLFNKASSQSEVQFGVKK